MVPNKLLFQMYILLCLCMCCQTAVTSSIKRTALIGDGTVELSARLLAANVIKMVWLPTDDNTTCKPSDDELATNMADMVTCLNSTLVALHVVGLTNCPVTSCRQVNPSCVIGVCDISNSLVLYREQAWPWQ